MWGLFGILATLIDVAAAVGNAHRDDRHYGVAECSHHADGMVGGAHADAGELYFSRKLKRTATDSKRVDTDLTTVIQRSISGISLTQLFGRQAHEGAAFEGAVRRSVRALLRFNWQMELYPLAVQTIFSLWGAAVFGYGGYLAYKSPDKFHLGDIIAFMAYLGQLWDPLSKIIGFKAAIQGHVVSSERVFFVLDQPVSVADAPDAIHLPVQPRTLTLRDVGFRYSVEGDPVLRGINATIRPGQMVAFIGPSGTGKSTLLSLLPASIRPDERFPVAGWVRPAQDQAGRRAPSYRAGSPGQHDAAASITENIGYGHPGATARQIREAAEMAGAAEFIEVLPDRYDTIDHEGGQNLSGGQRQRHGDCPSCAYRSADPGAR